MELNAHIFMATITGEKTWRNAALSATNPLPAIGHPIFAALARCHP